MKSIEYEVLEQSLETGSQGYDPLIINSLVQIG